MQNFYESISEQSINFDRSIRSIFVSESIDKASDTQVNLLRQRYYSNLTFIDYLAKTYGEMGYFKQILLYAFAIGITATAAIIVNPVFFIIGAISLNLLVHITLQYHALEARFSQLVYDLEESEKRLETAISENSKLEVELEKAVVKHHQLLAELEEGRLEVHRITRRVQENKQVVERACEVIEKSAQKSHQMVDKLIQVEAQTAQKGEQCMLLLDQIRGIVMQALEDINHLSENPMVKKLAEEYEILTALEADLHEKYGDILEPEDAQVLEAAPSYSFFSRRRSEHVVDGSGKNSPHM
jgi:hypothetical protein